MIQQKQNLPYRPMHSDTKTTNAEILANSMLTWLSNIHEVQTHSYKRMKQAVLCLWSEKLSHSDPAMQTINTDISIILQSNLLNHSVTIQLFSETFYSLASPY